MKRKRQREKRKRRSLLQKRPSQRRQIPPLLMLLPSKNLRTHLKLRKLQPTATSQKMRESLISQLEMKGAPQLRMDVVAVDIVATAVTVVTVVTVAEAEEIAAVVAITEDAVATTADPARTKMALLRPLMRSPSPDTVEITSVEGDAAIAVI